MVLPPKISCHFFSQGLWDVLSQDVGGQSLPVAFAEWDLRSSEWNVGNCSAMKLELLGLKWVVTENFCDYLISNPLLTSAKLCAVGQQWVSELALFDFQISYKPGWQNTGADALSWQYVGLLGGACRPSHCT